MTECNSLISILKQVSCFEDKGVTFVEKRNVERFISYKCLYETAQATLYNLQLFGIKSGDKVILQIEDNENFVYIFWACILGKIIPVPLTVGKNDEYKEKLFKVFGVLENPFLITGEKHLAMLEKYASQSEYAHEMTILKDSTYMIDSVIGGVQKGSVGEAERGDIAFIQFSSGSTGDPKGVVLTNDNLLTNMRAMTIRMEVTTADIFLQWMPLTHDMGMIGFHISPIFAQANQYLMPPALFIRNPLFWLEEVSTHKVTITCSPNFGYRFLLAQYRSDRDYQWDLSNLKYIMNGAEPISAELCIRFMDELSKYKLSSQAMCCVYGMAEACLGITCPDPGTSLSLRKLKRDSLGIGEQVIEAGEEDKYVSFVEVGYPLLDCAIKICDQDKNILKEDVIGNIWIKGRSVTKRYYNNDSETNRIIDSESWLLTGDVGFIRNGRLVVTGRTKDIIFIDSQNFYAHDIERVVNKVGGIVLGEVAACSAIDEVSKEESLLVFVRYKKKLKDFAPLALAIKEQINYDLGINAKYVVPVKKVLKTTSGKVQRYLMQKAYQDGEFNEIITELEGYITELIENQVVKKPRNEIEEKLLLIWTEVLDGIKIDINDNFFKKGGNSTLLAQMAGRLEQEYPQAVALADVFAYPTIAQLAAHISRNLAAELTISTISLPPEYFNLVGENDITALEFFIEDDFFSKVENLAKQRSMAVCDVLTAVYGGLFLKISEADNITIQTMTEQRGVVKAQNFALTDIIDVNRLLNAVSHKVKTENETTIYLLKDIEQQRINRTEYEIIPFIYSKNLLDTNENPLKVYDVAMAFIVESNKVLFLCEYNGNRLSKNKIKEFANQYLSLLMIAVEAG
jgi:surfactin family lipopeptide synthetase A